MDGTKRTEKTGIHLKGWLVLGLTIAVFLFLLQNNPLSNLTLNEINYDEQTSDSQMQRVVDELGVFDLLVPDIPMEPPEKLFQTVSKGT